VEAAQPTRYRRIGELAWVLEAGDALSEEKVVVMGIRDRRELRVERI